MNKTDSEEKFKMKKRCKIRRRGCGIFGTNIFVPFANRGERADEFLQVLTKIWSDDVVENQLSLAIPILGNKSSKN
ncbi:MAG: hypothetical protein WA323_03255 [Candidatus Nitrosopolaris sp.]|jgi:hypothetical protein